MPDDPTPADLAAAGQAAGETAAAAQARGATREEIRAEIAAELDARNIGLSDDDVKRISEGMIAALESRGAFDQTPAEPAAAGGVAGEETPDIPAGTPAPEPAKPPEPPRKLTFAERFAGRGR